ncbi:CocE/NonD family hydrolase [Mycobacterium tuberculosis]|uniref:CocE/NonD family hydrolase n=1 Tax=Mycobacterium tuberculosis TaxID=1773 RepID=UPI0039EE64F6
MSPTSPRASYAPSTAGSATGRRRTARWSPTERSRAGTRGPLVPGEIARLTFDLLPTSYLFQPGHRIRIAIAGADASHFAILPGCAPTVRVYRSRMHASRIDLPVIQP